MADDSIKECVASRPTDWACMEFYYVLLLATVREPSLIDLAAIEIFGLFTKAPEHLEEGKRLSGQLSRGR